MPEVLWDLLRKVQVRAIWDLWEQARVPLLQGHEELQGQTQVPLNLYDDHAESVTQMYVCMLSWVVKLLVIRS